MVIVQLSYIKLLEEITEKLTIGNPRCEVTLAAEGWFLTYIDVEIVRAGSIVETACCWGGPSPDIGEAKEDAARYALQKRKSELELQIKDANYDDYILYRSLYDHVTVQYADLLTRFTNLEREYNVLKNCYASTLAQNVEFVAEHVEMRHTIDECHTTINHLRGDRSVPTTTPSEAGSAS